MFFGDPATIPRLEVGDHILVTLCEVGTGARLPPRPAIVDRFDDHGNGFRKFPDHSFRASYARDDPKAGQPPFRWLNYYDYMRQWRIHDILDRLAEV